MRHTLVRWNVVTLVRLIGLLLPLLPLLGRPVQADPLPPPTHRHPLVAPDVGRQAVPPPAHQSVTRHPPAAFESLEPFEALAARQGRATAFHTLAVPALQTLQRSNVLTFPSPLTPTTYLPLIASTRTTPIPPPDERRAIWITRYDWTAITGAPAPTDIDDMVANIATADLNTIFFQVRAAGDAYYTPGLEPWADRLSAGIPGETLGQDPGWDPLARMLDQAHAAGIEVHAYVNVYTAWLAPFDETYGDLWPRATMPPSMFDRFTYGPDYAAHPGDYGLGYDWRQHSVDGEPMPLAWNSYLWATPNHDRVHAHIKAVILDIVTRYPVDGIHLDLVRYAGPAYSYDPAGNALAGSAPSPARAQWQRDRITAFVTDLHVSLPDECTLSAAVWPYTTDKWGWGVSEGYHDYYQDARGWLATGAVDAIAPMLYGGYADELSRWQQLTADFLADADNSANGSGQILPGIGTYGTTFAPIADRIAAARVLGAPGYALFSYSALDHANAWSHLAQVNASSTIGGD